MIKFTSLVFLLFFITFAQAQDDDTKKHFKAVKIDHKITIDGKDNEADWQKAPILTDFTQWQGDVGKPSTVKTEVRVLYDNHAVYIFVTNYDKREDVRTELSERDGIGNADFFGLFFDPFMSEINAFEFIVSATGGQFDAKMSQNGEDRAWDAVWGSKVVIHDDRWTAELEIPFSALRFPSLAVQDWGVNFFRRVQRIKEKSSWNKVDPDVDGFVNQAGIMLGVKDIDAPVRLSATPFVSAGIQKSNGASTQYSYGGGGDIKLGINNAFTLDMTVIPDFSQTRSDDKVVNISPFETYYSERRPFFTEGTELFDKGDLIYTRRIGGQPYDYYKAWDSNNELEKNPDKSQLINATKISGRTNKKLGIGFLNAVEGRTYATFTNGDNLQTNPLTNYNAIVFDQQLKNNSSIAIINSNVFREGAASDANVTALDFDLNTKSKKWGTNGNWAVSQIFNVDEPTTVGHKFNIEAGRVSGKFTYEAEYGEISDTYDQNDFGYLSRNNKRDISLYTRYQENSPKNNLRNYSVRLNMGLSRLYNPDVATNTWVNINGYASTKKFLFFGGGVYFSPVEGKDYYEPRRAGRYYKSPKLINSWVFFGTDSNKKLALYLNGSAGKKNLKNNYNIGEYVDLRYRFSDKLTSNVSLGYHFQKGSIGYLSPNEQAVGYDLVGVDDILFEERDVKNLTTSWSVSYKLNVKMSFSFFARNYWYKLKSNKYALLLENGELVSTPYLGVDDKGTTLHNRSTDFFNIDFVYRWNFSPGSDLYLTWKNDAYRSVNQLESLPLFSESFDDASNSITLKVLYYLDYNSLVSRKS